jgi:eukaryotic-like serine/threonine-protein kinase
MTSTTTGLPDRYRPLDQVGPDEPTPTGVIRCWRAKDRVLNRDVAIRVHTPAGPAAHAWIARALTAGGLATPALAMVYDASEGSGDPQAPGGAAYVVNEWIDGITLADRLTDGPMPERDARTVLRRLAEGIAEAHRVGLAVGGLTTDNVVLRPNGLVGLRAVPAATGSIDGDVAALGALLEACLTGLDPTEPEPRPLTGPSDLVALVRRARSTEPGQGLSSVAAMAALLAERPRPAGSAASSHRGHPADADRFSDSGWLRRLRDRRVEAGAPDTAPDAPAANRAARADAGAPVRLDPHTLPPVPPVRPHTGAPLHPAALGGDTIAAGSVPPAAGAYAGRDRTAHPADPAPTRHVWTDSDDDGALGMLGRGRGDHPADPPTGETDIDEDGARRHRFLVIGLPLIALAVVVALAVWLGKSVLSVAGNVDDVEGSTPSAGSPTAAASESAPATAGSAIPIAGGDVFDPGGDGQSEHAEDVKLTYDGDPTTAWSTFTYRGSPAFGNLKDGVGLLLDLGGAQAVAGVELTSISPGASVEIRVADEAGTDLDSFTPAADGTIEGTTQFAFDEPVTAGVVLVWITGLVPNDDGFSADIAEVKVQAAG